MARLWLKVMKNHRIAAQQTMPCEWGGEREAVNEICKQLDLPCPLWLKKHANEFATFRRTAFTAEHFMEETEFDRMEIEFLDDTDKKRKSADPRNQF